MSAITTPIARTAESVAVPRARSSRIAVIACAYVVFAAAIALFAQGYQLFQLTQVLVYALAILGLNLLIGYSGQLSLGHGAFFAMGAYGAAILVDTFNWPFLLTIPVAGAMGLVLGFLFGFPASRLAGHYLALATFALSMATPQLLKHSSVESWTGGAQGLVIDRGGAPSGIPLDPDQWFFLVCAAIVGVMFLMARNLMRSRDGRALEALRDQPIAAQTMGINTTMHRAIVFGISAMYVGMAGAMGGLLAQFVSPDSYSLALSIALLVGVVLGGPTRLSGAVWGAMFVLYVPNWLEHISKSAPAALYGVLLILVVLLMPAGIAGTVQGIAGRLGRRQSGN